MTISTFSTLEEMFISLHQQIRQAGSRMEKWQQEIKPGDCFIRTDNILPIYGVVLEVDKEDRELYEQLHTAGYRLTKCYSVLCPEGEVGDTHVSCIDRVITLAEFLHAKNCGWETDDPQEDLDLMEQDLDLLDLHPLFFCPNHSSTLGLFAQEPEDPKTLVCGCPTHQAEMRGWE